MFDFFKSTRDKYPEEIQPIGILKNMSEDIHRLQKVVDAMCKVYVAEHAKEINSRDPDERWFKTDQPIIDHAKRLELERQIMVAEMELKELKRKVIL